MEAGTDEQRKKTTIGISKVGPRMLLSPEASITSRDIEALEGINKDLKQKNQNEIIMDMKNVSFIDSISLEYLLTMHHDLKKRGGILKLINVNSICRDIFIATRLINVFHLFDDIHDSIKN